MRKLSLAAMAMACVLSASGAANAKTLGIVALLANDALNIDVIGGATEAAKGGRLGGPRSSTPRRAPTRPMPQ